MRGGVIDMAQLGRSLVSYGRPDAAFALLSADGPQSLYHMANSTGTLWAHPGGSDGNKGKCSSHNHIMQGGSVGEAIFGLGGIEPGFMRGEVPDALPTTGKLRLAPVPWIPDAPRGARTYGGRARQMERSLHLLMSDGKQAEGDEKDNPRALPLA